VNWEQVVKVFKSLLASPIFGFVLAGGLLLLAKRFIKLPALFKAPPKDAPPPFWIRCILILTCTGVSFFHGSNDGAKGMGLMLLILIGILPATYALNMGSNSQALRDLEASANSTRTRFVASASGAVSADPLADLSSYIKSDGKLTNQTFAAMAEVDGKIAAALGGRDSLESLSTDQRRELRSAIYLQGEAVGKLGKAKDSKFDDLAKKGAFKDQLQSFTQHVPTWVKIAVALALGLGTMIGWKRIVMTVGEKIGKDHLTYAQGASAEIVAMLTIGAADYLGLPVSTTHVLSSGVAGTMAANKSGLQVATLRNLLLAWVLTLPVCVILGAGTFAAGLYLVLHQLVTHTVIFVGILLLIAGALLFRRVIATRSKAGFEPVTADAI
jgi:PiT family inorganic phosphate transporter